ncbi:hypothetical protein C2S53_007813 [Perilla frutescens var. hirtella]|uniref:non-specific serine/threonine protein kinase n=1 Tax=Perilla frutescens var. hirtella TaxID=608512 RepID=A0AAD4IWL6_PERFH|nr:hypothetical protein C2S53_007813 [Perilla frutescens var. hirtella]
MKENDLHANIYIVCFILVSRSSLGADYRYEACRPRNCGKGPNISFPFYITGLQNSYCGYPGFMLNCSHEFPVLQLPETQYIVNEISYEARSFRVYDSAVSSRHDSDNDCVPRIRNTSLPTPQFDFADNVTMLRLFSNCSHDASLSENNRTSVVCDAEDRGGRILALYEGDENVANALKNCGSNSVAPVEDDDGVGVAEMGKSVVEILRRGFVIKWNASECSKCETSGGRCGFNETTYMFRCFCPHRPRYRSCRPEKDGSKLILAAAIFGGGVFLLVCMLISLVIWRCKKRFKNASNLSKPDVEWRSFYLGTHVFSYKELMAATNNFDSSQELGDGGFGTVYYGKLVDGREVAIKRLYEHNYRRVEQFMNEIKILSCLRHKNLVSLYGCTSTTSKELLLVYEYVINGTVADHLHGERAVRSPLTWDTRMKIAIETASALAYLHRSDIIHRDVKTSNILLDTNFSVKVADFGLSRLSVNDATHISTAPQGTAGYVDPTYQQSYHLTTKSDVYSFGVVLIELVSSKPAVDISRHTNEINLANLAVSRIERRAFDELVDESLGFESDVEVARMTTAVAELAFRCLQLDKDIRPSMDEVLNLLNQIQGLHEFEFETTKEVDDDIDIITSPETDGIVLMKKRNFESSPNAVTDRWISNSTAKSSYHKSMDQM